MDNGFVRKNQENYNLIEKEIEKLMEEIQDLEGELTLIGTCPRDAQVYRLLYQLSRSSVELQHYIFTILESSKFEVTVAGSITFIMTASLQRST
ncbi:hypothetical protein TNCV_4836571 [Trichonephila clavipes]|nr:hypothetical protein TNCV_4836571 [Trichonephila clavipes]